MKSFSFKFLFFSVALTAMASGVYAQDDDGIYGDIYQAPQVQDELIDTNVSPLDGYSTVDDYYPEGGYTSSNRQQQPYSEQYVDENGNNITNNYYGDYYEDSDYFYASRIRRFHRNYGAWGYYDPFYTNMYYYNYDPFFWGTSIYVGAWPYYGWGWNNWGWNSGFGWNYGLGWNSGWGWYGGFGMPACYGGWGGGYWNGYNNGYWHGFNNGLAYGGYFNTFDTNSGIYYGHRGSSVSSGSNLGTGYRTTSFASVYNDAAKEGKVAHANRGNVLQTADARPVKGNLDGYNVRSTTTKTEVTRGAASTVDRTPATTSPRTEPVRERSNVQESATRNNPYQRSSTERATSTQREASPTIDRSRYRATTTQPRTNSGSVDRNVEYQRGNAIDPSRSATEQRGNMYRDLQRTQPNSNNGYIRGDSRNDYRQQPSRSGSDYRNGNQYSRPSDQRNIYQQQPSRNATPSRNYSQPSRNATPSRNYQQPSRNVTPAPSRSPQPSRSVSPSPSPSRGSSGGSFSSPSRSSGSSMPSRSSSSPSRGGRP